MHPPQHFQVMVMMRGNGSDEVVVVMAIVMAMKIGLKFRVITIMKKGTNNEDAQNKKSKGELEQDTST